MTLNKDYATINLNISFICFLFKLQRLLSQKGLN